RVFVAGGDDFDRADVEDAFEATGIDDSRAGDFAKRTVEDVDVEHAGKADDSQIGQDVEATHPLQHGPHDAAGDQDRADFHPHTRLSGEVAVENFSRDHRDQNHAV